MIKKIQNAKTAVKHFLTIRPELRDSDSRLMANIWASELKETGIHEMSAWDFLKMFSQDILTSPESIRRARQKIQEECPHLRGKSYKARHQKGFEVTHLINK